MSVLREIRAPGLNQDILSLNIVRDVKIGEGGTVSFALNIAGSLESSRSQIETQIQEKLQAAGFSSIDMRREGSAPARSASPQIPGVKAILAVSSGKGGVGKSTVSANLAAALALSGLKVGLMDADVYGPNIPTMLGCIDGPKIAEDPIKGEVFVPPVAHGLKLMSMGFLIQGDQPLVWRGPMLHNIINQFCHKVNWGELDVLVVDMPPGTGDVQLSLAQLVPLTGTVLVTTPQEVAMQDVRKAFHMWEKVKIPVFGVVENMSYFKDDTGKKHAIFGQGGGKLLAQKFNTELLAEIPLVTRVREAGDGGVPIVIAEPQSEVAAIFRKLATDVRAHVLEKKNEASLMQIGRFS